MVKPSWSSALALAVTAIALVLFVRVVAANDPPEAWILWRYLAVLGWSFVFGASALAGGWAVQARLGGQTPFRERLLQAFALGIIAWVLAIVLLGLVGGLGRVAFVAVPLGFLAVGLRPLVKAILRARALLARLRPTRPSVASWLVTGGGVIGVALIWANLLSPRNLTYDARWYHLPLAEQYAAAGAVFRLAEGSFNGTMPHLASYLYTWGFLAPGKLFDHLELAAHLEFVIFLATLASIPVLIDRLLPRPRLQSSWPARFLFPGVLLYDSTLGGGADHVLAFWAVPMVLALARFWRAPDSRSAVLFGAMAGAAALTKYQALYLLVGPALAVLSRALVEVARTRRVVFVRASGVAVVAALLVSAPHWFLNTLWHHNPIYPFASKVFPSIPMAEGIEPHIAETAWIPGGTLPERLQETLGASLRFGFEAHDWETFHGSRPVFGTLFLIAVALIPFAFRRRAVGALALATWLGVPVWYWTQHQDRYLQALAPWCTAVVVAVFFGVWRKHPLARLGLLALMTFQLAHAADLPTLPSHAILHTQPLVDVLSLLSKTEADAPERYVTEHFSISRAEPLLPPEAKVLVHEIHMHVGLGRVAVRDNIQRQGAISYHVLGNTGAVVEKMRELGVTHALWSPTPNGMSMIGDDLVFLRFAQHAVRERTPLGDGFLVGAVTDVPVKQTRALVLTCTTEQLHPRELQRDWHRLYYSQCDAPPAVDLATLASNEEVVVVDTRRYPGQGAVLEGSFELLFDRNGFNVWSRRPGM